MQGRPEIKGVFCGVRAAEDVTFIGILVEEFDAGKPSGGEAV